jgi:hypothetical protein
LAANVQVYEPTCNAHRAFPPFFASAIEAVAAQAQGRTDDAIAEAQKISGNSRLPAHMRQAADRALVNIAAPLLLGEERIGLQTTLATSERVEDRLAATAVDLLQFGIVREKPERSALLEWLKEPVPESQPRRAARNLLLLALADVPGEAVTSRLKEALEKFRAARDEQGLLICNIALAVCMVAAEVSAESVRSHITTALASPAFPCARPMELGADSSANDWIDWFQTVPRSWWPWITRLIVCAIRAQEFQRGGEETTAIQKWLSERYPTGVPAGIALLLQPTPQGAAAAARTPTDASQAVKEPIWQSVLGVLLGILGIAVVPSFVYGMYKGQVAALGAIGVHLGFWGNVAVLLVLFGVLGTVPQAFRSLMKLVARTIQVEIRIRAGPDVLVTYGGETDNLQINDPFRVHWQIDEQVRIYVPLFGYTFPRFAEGQSKTTTFASPYRAQSEMISESNQLKTSLSSPRWIPQSAAFNAVISVDEKSSAAPWEAVIGLMGGQLQFFSEHRLAFRRERADLRIYLDTPMRRDLRVEVWSVEHIGSRFAATWQIGLKDTWRLKLMAPEFSRGTLRRDEGVGFVHILGRPTETEGGLHIQMSKPAEPSFAEDMIRPAQVASALPSVRLCIVQDFPEPPRPRVASDRYSANLARRLCFHLISAGIPAAIYLPPLAEDLAAWVVQSLAHVLGSSPRLGLSALQQSVHQIRQRIAASREADPEAATEIAFDVCFYGPASLNLKRAKHAETGEDLTPAA